MDSRKKLDENNLENKKLQDKKNISEWQKEYDENEREHRDNLSELENETSALLDEVRSSLDHTEKTWQKEKKYEEELDKQLRHIASLEKNIHVTSTDPVAQKSYSGYAIIQSNVADALETIEQQTSRDPDALQGQKDSYMRSQDITTSFWKLFEWIIGKEWTESFS